MGEKIPIDMEQPVSFIGFRLKMERVSSKYMMMYYIPTSMFVFVSWTNFIFPPTAYPARCGLVVTTLLVLVNTLTRYLCPLRMSLVSLQLWLFGLSHASVLCSFLYSPMFSFLLDCVGLMLKVTQLGEIINHQVMTKRNRT